MLPAWAAVRGLTSIDVPISAANANERPNGDVKSSDERSIVIVVSLSGVMDRLGCRCETRVSCGRVTIYLRCEFRSVVTVSVETTGDGIVVVVCSEVVVWS